MNRNRFHSLAGTGTRRSKWGAVALAVLFTAFVIGGHREASAAQQKLKQVSLRFDVTASGYDAPFLLAANKGWYADHGLEVKFGEGSGSATTVQLVAEGRDTFAYADFGTMMTLVDQGANVKAVAIIGQESPLGVITRQDGPIHTLKDLYGHRLLLNLRGASAPLFQAVVNKQNIDKSKIKIVNTSADVTNAMLLAQKRIDAFVGWETFELPMLTDIGVAGRVLPFRDYGVNVMNVSLIAADSTIQNHPDLVKGFVAASLEGWKYAAQHPDQAVDILVKEYPNVKRSIALNQLKTQLKLLHTPNSQGKPIGWASAEDVAATQNILLETKVIKKQRPTSDYYTDKFVPSP